MLNSTAFEENTVAVGSLDTQAVSAIACNGCVSKMMVRLHLDSEEDQTKNIELDTITLAGSGRNLLTFYGTELESVTKSSIHRGNTITERVYILDFTVGHHLPGFSGAASFREIAAPSVTVTFSAPGGPATLHVSHDQLELISILGSNGRIQQNIST